LPQRLILLGQLLAFLDDGNIFFVEFEKRLLEDLVLLLMGEIERFLYLYFSFLEDLVAVLLFLF
jgi:hypothetical protein